MFTVRKIPRKMLPILIVVVAMAAVAGFAVGIKISSGNSPPKSKPVAVAVTPEIETLLNKGHRNDTAEDYFEETSPSFAGVAAGNYNSNFRNLGELLVKDGLSHTIIGLGREMNGSWYEWSERRAPSSDPDAYIRAWRQIVTTMRSVPGQQGKWQQILTTEPGGLNWMAAFSHATGKPIIIPEWGLDFHTFGGKDNPLFIRNMLAWMKAHHAIGLYWAGGHVSPASTASGPLLVNQGASSQNNTPGTVNGMGELMGGRLQFAGVYLPDHVWPSEKADQPVLAPWQHAGYQLILSVPIMPNPPAIKSYSGPPEPGHKSYQLADYPDAVAALRQGGR